MYKQKHLLNIEFMVYFDVQFLNNECQLFGGTTWSNG